VRVPGLTNIWVPPIRNRIDMLATGIKSPVGVKVLGSDLAVINRLTARSSSRSSRCRGDQRLCRAADGRALHRTWTSGVSARPVTG
jgi:Cu/Ag efflux pump CusA